MAYECFQNWSVQKLKTELRKRSATTHGRKSDLVERLKAYERNRNFRQSAVYPPDAICVFGQLLDFSD
ncbi:hypothetical protein KP79_PYT24183 [Mizuhopecten yessoensis]|uniref:SAP domain-containing protein n=1 Tax=Mizuhopecten yessoensis TaxID=6573 RepID=A0A210PHS7_MIZYE|nr:hypothetical protein KP79_PYT24183 [Mizuhopecten yessoensis]